VGGCRRREGVRRADRGRPAGIYVRLWRISGYKWRGCLASAHAVCRALDFVSPRRLHGCSLRGYLQVRQLKPRMRQKQSRATDSAALNQLGFGTASFVWCDGAAKPGLVDSCTVRIPTPFLSFFSSSSSLMANSYWSISVSTTWRHCRRSAARRQAEWTPVLNDWTSRETALNNVSRGRPLGLLHHAGGLLIAASSYDLLAR